MDRFFVFLLLSLGAVAQIGLMVPHRLKKIGITMAWALGVTIASIPLTILKGEAVRPDSLQFMFFLFFLFLSFFSFKKEILPRVDEALVLCISAVFWYAALSLFGMHVLLWIFVPATLWTIYEAVNPKPPGPRARQASYAWFMVCSFCLGLLLAVGPLVDALRNSSAIDLVLSGMAFTYLFIIGLQLFRLIPIPGKRQSVEDRMKEWHEDLALLTGKFDEKVQLTRAHAVLLMLAWAFVLSANFFLKAVSVETMVGLSVLGMTAWNLLVRTNPTMDLKSGKKTPG